MWSHDERSWIVCSMRRVLWVWQPLHGMGDARTLDRDEGRALHSQVFREAVDWYDPPGESEVVQRGVRRRKLTI